MARAPTRNLRALPQGGVELQQWKPSPLDSMQMATELLLVLMLTLSLSTLSLLGSLPYLCSDSVET